MVIPRRIYNEWNLGDINNNNKIIIPLGLFRKQRIIHPLSKLEPSVRDWAAIMVGLPEWLNDPAATWGTVDILQLVFFLIDSKHIKDVRRNF